VLEASVSKSCSALVASLYLKPSRMCGSSGGAGIELRGAEQILVH
jgi:hypothetical protein